MMKVLGSRMVEAQREIIGSVVSGRGISRYRRDLSFNARASGWTRLTGRCSILPPH